MRFWQPLVLSLLCLCLAAPVAGSPLPAPPSQVVTPTPGPTDVAAEQQFLVLLNTYRAQHGAGPLVLDAHLQAATDWMVEDMYQRSLNGTCCDHVDSLGRSPAQRDTAFGYPCPAVFGCGENLEWGSYSILGPADAALAFWQGDAPHDQNQLSTAWTVIGVSRICIPPTGGGCWWAADFGTGLSAAVGVSTGTATAPVPTSPAAPTATATLAPALGTVTATPANCPQISTTPFTIAPLPANPPPGAANPRPAVITPDTEVGWLYDYNLYGFPYLFWTPRLGFAYVKIGGTEFGPPGGNGTGILIDSLCHIILMQGPMTVLAPGLPTVTQTRPAGAQTAQARRTERAFKKCFDITDFSRLSASFGQHGSNLELDLNGDGVVDLTDLSLLAAAFCH